MTTCLQCFSGADQEPSPATEDDLASLQDARSGPAGAPEDTPRAPPQAEPKPFDDFEVPRASPHEEDLDTIAEEPTAETQASQTQSSHAQALGRPLESSELQQVPEEEEGPATSGIRSGNDQTDSQDGSLAKRGEAYDGMDTEGSQAGLSDSHTPSEQPHHSLAGTQLLYVRNPHFRLYFCTSEL